MSDGKQGAFPLSRNGKLNTDCEIYAGGISIRTYLSSAAMTGILSGIGKGIGSWTDEDFKRVAEKSYQMSDAMLKVEEQ